MPKPIADLNNRATVQSFSNTSSYVQEGCLKKEAFSAGLKDTSGRKRHFQSASSDVTKIKYSYAKSKIDYFLHERGALGSSFEADAQSDDAGEVMLEVYKSYKAQAEFIEKTYPDQSLLNRVLQKDSEIFSSEEKFSEVERHEQKLLNDNSELQKKMKSTLAAAFESYGGNFTIMTAERERVFQEFSANSVETTKSDNTNSDVLQEEFWDSLASFYREDEDISF